MSVFVEWGGAATGLLGAGLLALNHPSWSRWGFVAFLASNMMWISFGVATSAWGLVAMQVGFTATSLVGIYRWFIAAGAESVAVGAVQD